MSGTWEDANYKSILKAEVCPINPIPSDSHRKTVDWFSYDKSPEQTIAVINKKARSLLLRPVIIFRGGKTYWANLWCTLHRVRNVSMMYYT